MVNSHKEPKNYRRTWIRRLSVHGYRSLRDVEIDGLPEKVILYGPNGSGKSSLMRAVRLLLRAVTTADEVPTKREEAVSLSLQEADKKLHLRLEDFYRGGKPEIRVSVEIGIGDRARSILGVPVAEDLYILTLCGIFQSIGDGKILFWCDRADVDGTLMIGRPEDEKIRQIRKKINAVRNQIIGVESQIANYLSTIEQEVKTFPREHVEAKYRAAILQATAKKESLKQDLIEFEKELGESALAADRIRLVLCRELLQLHEAYRMPGGEPGLERALHDAMLSPDPENQSAIDRLGERLARVRLFGAQTSPVALRPVVTTFGERQVHFFRSPHGWLPISNLGTGEQQIILMLGQSLISRRPIALLEEPEAHLHPKLMGPLADFLSESVVVADEQPDIDQIWMATHHHMFAIDEDFFDVSLDDDGATVVRRRPRSEAVEHFYEPGPFWDALRELVSSGLEKNAVITLNANGEPIRAQDLLESIEGNRKLAREFVDTATRSVVLSIRKQQEKPKQ